MAESSSRRGEDVTHMQDLESWQHSHSFGQERKRPGENRTLLVIAITGTMMVIEVAAGLVFGSMERMTLKIVRTM